MSLAPIRAAIPATIERRPTVLDGEALERFARDGFVQVREAFDPELALAFQREAWDELRREQAVDVEDPATWRVPGSSPRATKHSERNAALDESRLPGVVSDLLGDEGWPRQSHWGGFLVTFPHADARRLRAQDELPTDLWHWDGDPLGRGLLVFAFYSQVGPGGGGTQVLRGSHRLVQAYYDGLDAKARGRPHKHHRRALSRSDPWLARLTGHASPPLTDRRGEVPGLPLEVVELTGGPGDAVFCNPGLLHAPTPNLSDRPRLMRVKFLFLDR